MHVMKFGALSVSTPARLREMAQIIKRGCDQVSSLVVICTALDGVTDALISAARMAGPNGEAAVEHARRQLWGRHRALAEKLVNDEWEREALYREWAELLKLFDRIIRSIATLGEHSPRSIDAVAALGERFAAHLVAAVLRQSGVAAQLIDATELIVTDKHFGSAHPLLQETTERVRARLNPLVHSRIVPVVSGYIGATRDGIVTTLGRGGGDYSATLIGAALEAEEVCLWTDVDGIMTADPKIVPSASTLNELSYQEAAEIATFGAEVLHPRTLIPVAKQGIPLCIRNVLHPDHPGTRVIAHPQPSVHLARAIISTLGLSLISVSSPPDASQVEWPSDLAARPLAQLSEAGVEIITFAQSFSERRLMLAVRGSDTEFARECLSSTLTSELGAGSPHQIDVTSPVALVAVISAPGNNNLAPRTLASLGRAGAHVFALAQGVPSFHISFLLPEAEVSRVVQALHHDLGMAGL